MVEEMASLLENFPGSANQTRCFLHVLNLTAKSVLQQFEIPKKRNNDGDDGDNPDNNKVLKKAISELQALSEEIEEEATSQGEIEDVEDDDNDEGLEDERQDLTEEQIAELEEDLTPVRLMLTKVCSDDSAKFSQPTHVSFQLRALSNTMKNSTTVILPQWNIKLKELRLDIRMMPRDVATRWNSTFDMIDFSITYRSALDAMTANRGLNLRKFELDNEEWIAAEKLRDTLRVHFYYIHLIDVLTSF